MWDLFARINQAVSKIEQERGAFDVKCLVSRRSDYVLWDLVLTAIWFEEDEKDRLAYLTDNILSDLDIDQLIQFSAIITYPAETRNSLTDLLHRIQQNAREGQYPAAMDEKFIIVETHSEIARRVVPLVDIPAGVTLKTEKEKK